MRITLLSIALTLISFATHAGISVNGLPVLTDNSSPLMLCSVPERWFEQPLTAKVDCDIPGAIVTIDGHSVTNGDRYAFGDIGRNHTYSLTVTTSAGTTTQQLAFTALPIVIIDGDFDSDYHPATMALVEPGEPEALRLSVNAKYRGGITNNEYSHKHNFHVKLVDGAGNKVNRPLLGMRNDNNWILDAGQIDLARIRNHVGMDLWRDFSTKPYYFKHIPEAVNGVHSEFVEAFVNGRYDGIYSLGEAIDRKQLRLKKYDENPKKIHGQLWKSISWESPVKMNSKVYSYNNYLDQWGGMALKYPEIDEVSPTDWSTLSKAARFVVESSDEVFVNQVSDFFDIPVLRDYYIFCQVLKAIDNRGKNMYWFVYDKVESKKISVSPWDLDATVGQYYTDLWTSDKEASISPTVELSMKHGLFDRLVQLNPAGFYTLVLQRYRLLRQSTFTLDNLTARYIQPIERLQRIGAAQRETSRWSGDSDIANLNLDFDEQKALIRQWFTDRLQFLDQQFQIDVVRGDVNGDKIVDIDDVNLTLNVMMKKNTNSQIAKLADVNNDGEVDIDDMNLLLNIMFIRRGPTVF